MNKTECSQWTWTLESFNCLVITTSKWKCPFYALNYKTKHQQLAYSTVFCKHPTELVIIKCNFNHSIPKMTESTKKWLKVWLWNEAHTVLWQSYKDTSENPKTVSCKIYIQTARPVVDSLSLDVHIITFKRMTPGSQTEESKSFWNVHEATSFHKTLWDWRE